MKKELYYRPKAVNAVYFDGNNIAEVQAIAPKSVVDNVKVTTQETLELGTYTYTQKRVILNGDTKDIYDNILYPGQWVIAKEYPKSKYHKDGSETPSIWYEVVDNIDDYIETSKVTITE